MNLLNEDVFNSKTFKDKNGGDGFRRWFIKKLPNEAKKINLDPQGPYNNSYIVKALNTPYKNTTAGNVYLKSTQKNSWRPSNVFNKTETEFNNQTFSTKYDGILFRRWFNQNFPNEAKKIDLSVNGPHNNQYIVTALNLPYKNSNIGTFYFKNKGKNLISNVNWLTEVSPQVKNQVEYLKSIKFKRSHTILDDTNSVVYAVNKDFSLYRKFNVITGKDRGDEKKIMTITDWFVKNYEEHLRGMVDQYKNNHKISNIINSIKDDYLGSPLFSVKNTPSGIYRRDDDLWGFLGKMRNLILTSNFFNTIYGEKYISWEDTSGKLIPIGFHGTKSKVRLKSINDVRPPHRRKISYGCVNFNDNDILTINKFIKIGQYSFWLPDMTDDIVKLVG